jgi:hypothetical protein
MRSTRLLLAVSLLLSSAALAQSHVRLSYEMAKLRATPRASSTTASAPSAGTWMFRSRSPTPHFEFGRPEQLQHHEGGRPHHQRRSDVYGKQYRYLNVVPLMAGSPSIARRRKPLRAGCNGGVGYFDRDRPRADLVLGSAGSGASSRRSASPSGSGAAPRSSSTAGTTTSGPRTAGRRRRTGPSGPACCSAAPERALRRRSDRRPATGMTLSAVRGLRRVLVVRAERCG